VTLTVKTASAKGFGDSAVNALLGAQPAASPAGILSRIWYATCLLDCLSLNDKRCNCAKLALLAVLTAIPPHVLQDFRCYIYQ